MNKKFHSKFYSIFLTLLLLISLVTMPLSTIVYAESASDEAEDDVTVGEPEESEKTEGNETNHEDAEEVDPEVDHPEAFDERDASEDGANEVTDDEQPIAEIVEFEDDLVREAVKRELEIESDDISVSDMENLRSFYINLWDNDSKISLKGLEHAVNLRTLTVTNTDVEDTWVVENFKKLEGFNFYNTNIEDISVLKNLTQLVGINISSTNVTDISSLKNLTNLMILDLNFTKVSDISVLENFKKLDIAGLGSPNITDISVLEHLQELEEVALFDTKITDIKVLRKLPNIRNVVFDEIHIEAFDFETLDLLVENGVTIGWYGYQWYIKQLDDLFPEDEGFRVNEEKKQVTAHVQEDSYTLSADQVEALKQNKVSIVLEKEGVTTSIPISVFTGYGAVEITIEEVDKEANSYSNVYAFTIKQGNDIISEFNKEEPISLTFKVDAKDANNVEHLQVFYLNETTGNWENIGGKYNAATGTVTATTDHFSTFTVFEADEVDSDNIVVKVIEPSEEEEESDDGTGTTNDDTQITTEDSTSVSTKDENTPTDDDSGVTNNNKESMDKETDQDGTALLPNTATNMYKIMFVGLALLLAGVAIVALRRFSGKKA